MVEHDLAKVGVAGSSPVFRSKSILLTKRIFKLSAQVVELVDTQDLKSCDHCDRAGSSPAPGTVPVLSSKFDKTGFFISPESFDNCEVMPMTDQSEKLGGE